MTAVERAIALREVEAFRSVPMEQLAHVAAASREERFAEGSVFFREGDPPGGLLVVLEGAVRLERGGKVLGEAVAGETLGAWSLFDEHRRRATAMAARDTRVLILEREAFYEVLSEHVEIVKSMFRDLVHRLLALAGPADEETR
jgi:CRP-like cAMP-binding protein